jgi:urease accessory protein
MLRLTEILGVASDPSINEKLHALEHQGTVETLELDPADTLRRRLRATTSHGTECAILLPRSQQLGNGSILLLDDDRAIVVKMKKQPWLTLKASDLATALELGYFAGNMHWRVHFDGPNLSIALEGREQDYIDRLHHFFAEKRVEKVSHD